jgi:hypothetical protein
VSDRERRLSAAQRILDREEGDLTRALTYATFRYTIVRVIAESWPNALPKSARPRWWSRKEQQ